MPKNKKQDYRSIQIRGRSFELKISKNKKRRDIFSLKVTPKLKLHLSVHPSFLMRQIPQVLHEKADWIFRQMDEYANHPYHLESLLESSRLLYHGKAIPLRVTLEPERKRTYFNLEDEMFLLKISPEKNTTHLIKQEIIKGLKKIARKELALHLEEQSRITGINFSKFALKDTTSRWGSCSAKKNINLSWRLVMAPEPVARYVALHELCHIPEQNHSKRFWALVEQYMHQWKKCRNWLKEHGWVLHSF